MTAPFDPLVEAHRQWEVNGLGEATAMHAAVSMIHAHQLVTTAIERALRPFGLSFARYEVLTLLSFSRNGSLPITKIGERLLVHPTGITRLVDKLEAGQLVARTAHPTDRRTTLVRLTTEGRDRSQTASGLLAEIRFGIPLDDPATRKLIVELDALRTALEDG